MWQQLLSDLKDGDIKALSRTISFVENEQEGYENLMQSLPENGEAKIIGITGPPGAGKSTLVDALIGEFVKEEKKVAVLCVDPSSPFNMGSLLGDRIRMSNWYVHPSVYIRSLATRGSMGGLHPKIIEISDLVKAAGFDYVIIETVGVGQSEIEIAGLADTTVVVLVPEGGDEIQTMKAGLMEIADIFVVNKSDRPDADAFVNNLMMMLAPAFQSQHEVQIIKTEANSNVGIRDLMDQILIHQKIDDVNDRKIWLLAEKAFHLIESKRMRDISRNDLAEKIRDVLKEGEFNIYAFVEEFK